MAPRKVKEKEKVQEYEYKFERFNLGSKVNALEQATNELAAEGYRLFSILVDGRAMVAVFERCNVQVPSVPTAPETPADPEKNEEAQE